MAEGVDMEKFHKMLECSICLELYTNPKILKCDHEFCKQCIEDIAVCLNDGSATITCPFRCEKLTILDKDQTVDDLGASYVFKNILEALKSDKETKISNPHVFQCVGDANCMKPISMFYSGKLMCLSCYNRHMNTDGRHCKVDVTLNHRKDKLMVLCEFHGSVCTHLCADGKFLCMYCLHRDHRHHAKNEVDTEVLLLREAMVHAISKGTIVHDAALGTLHNIALAEEKLKKLLKQRKKQCLAQYKLLLGTAEKNILEQFEKLTASHMELYSAPRTKYYEEIIKKLDIEVILQKADILRKIDDDKSISVPKRVNVSLSRNWDYLTVAPLGDLDCYFHDDKRKMKSAANPNSTAVKGKNLKSKSSVKVAQTAVLSDPKVKEEKIRKLVLSNTTNKAVKRINTCNTASESNEKLKSMDCNSSKTCGDLTKESNKIGDALPNATIDKAKSKEKIGKFVSKNQDANGVPVKVLNTTSDSILTPEDNQVKIIDISDIYMESRNDPSRLIDTLAAFLQDTIKSEGGEISIPDTASGNNEELQDGVFIGNNDTTSGNNAESQNHQTANCKFTENELSCAESKHNETEYLNTVPDNAQPEGVDFKNSITAFEDNAESSPEASGKDTTEFDLEPGGADDLNQEHKGNGQNAAFGNEEFKGDPSETTTNSSRKIRACEDDTIHSNEVAMIKKSDGDIDTLLDSLIAKDDSKCNIYSGNCKNSVSVLGQKCDLCFQMFCLPHRLPEVHGCGKAAKVQARQGMSTNCGKKCVKDSDAKKKAKLRNKLSSKLSKLEDKRKKK